VITGTHAVLYSADAPADRAFFRDVLGFPYVDAHDGWLIFAFPPAEAGVHPADAPRQEVYLMCDDVRATVAELTAKGVTFAGDVTDAGFGLLVEIRLPSGAKLGLYEPKHPIAPQG
jgi:catechol 2,3-dioxygenase-like lactoylglutathione lyase family enzyme